MPKVKVPLLIRWQVLKARLRRWAYLISEGMYRGECPITITDKDDCVTVIGSGVPIKPGVFGNYRLYFERDKIVRKTGTFNRAGTFQMQEVRYIETRGCMGTDAKIVKGVVVKQVMKEEYPTAVPEPFFCVTLETGDSVELPRGAFTRAEDGVLEYRY